MKSLIIVFFIMLFFGSEKKTDESFFSLDRENIKIQEDVSFGKTDTFQNNILKIQTAREIKIMSYKRRLNSSNKNDEDYGKCKKWSISIKELETIIRKFEQLSSEEQHLLYLYLPCEATGEIKIDKKIYKYWLNAGATLTLKDHKRIFYYGYAGLNYKKYFLSGKDFSE